MRRVDLMSKTTTLVTMLSIVYALIDMKIIFLAPILTISIPYRFMKYKEEGKHTENRKILNNLLLFNLIVFIGVIAITNRMSTDIFEIIVNIIITFIYFKVLSMIDKKREILYNNPQMVYDKINEKMDYAINVDVPDENIVNRMGGRRACPGCGCTYHIKHNPPKVEDICDVCGAKLVLRDDDKPETVTKRLSVYHEQTKPLIDFYKKEGVLREVDGTQDLNDVFQAITEILGA